MKTHQYVKAINYYNEAVLNADHSSLKLDLSELYLKLKQYTNAEQTLISDIETLTGLVVFDLTEEFLGFLDFSFLFFLWLSRLARTKMWWRCRHEPNSCCYWREFVNGPVI